MYKVLGKTGLKVYPVGLGGIPLQRIEEAEATEIIKFCYDNSINFIDTAKGYTVSESYIGNAIKTFENDFIIATKSMGRTYEAMKKEIEEALTALKVDSIDLYQLHNVGKKDYDLVISENGAYRALLEAKKEGKVKHIGFTTHTLIELEKAVESGLFETVQFPFNIVEAQGVEILKLAKEKNIGTIAMKPLAGGAIDNSDLAIRYVLNSGIIDIVIPGMATKEEIEKNIAASKKSDGFTKEEQIEIDRIKKELGDNFCRRCGYCLPCPSGIDIPTTFILQKYISNYGLREWGASRYLDASKNWKSCIKCNACVAKCPYNLPIPNMVDTAQTDLETCINELGLR